MPQDMCVPCEDGLINLRVGAIIQKDGKILLVGNRLCPDYLYSVGGRIKFGETAEEAIVREVLEETGARLKVDRLGFVHENYFYGDMPGNRGKLIYEISFYYYMQVPDDFEPAESSMTDAGETEYLCWIDPESPIRYYPAFFRTVWNRPEPGVRYFTTDERNEASKTNGPTA